MPARPLLRQLIATLLALTGVTALTAAAAAPAGVLAAKPNVVVIMVDDMNAAALQYLPNVRSLLATPGTTFDNSVVSYSLCCPSRSTFLTGQYAHNHGVLGNKLPDGGYEKLPAAETLPVWLRRAGYATAHVGKFLNGYGRERPTEIPPGWAEWYGSVDPSTYRMWNYTLNENGTLHTYGVAGAENPALYQTDVYARKAVDYIQRKAPANEPFFLSFAPLAPHGEGAATGSDLSQRNPRPAPRHRGDLESVKLPKPPSYDEADVSDKPAAIRNKPRITPANEDRIENVRLKGRLESLLSVDEAVADIVAALQASGELANTLIVFTSDNGWMQGEHRIQSGKTVPYEESIRVPLIIRGPGLPVGGHVSTLAANIDLAPTILDVADASAGVTVDGRSLLPIAADPASSARGIVIETGPKQSGKWYAGLRTPRWKYVEHSTGERELYDLQQDPYELASVHNDPRYAATRRALADRLAILRTCAGAVCRQWTPVPAPTL
ncbi:sulfatase family protein [Streptosporangium sp. NBC_01756]|uniref:sulfatase family protein n=1 Tax=Streptosporangium sp. NBC_01756 TaxID=2975950 RepID=UPI002DDAB4B1|nr:sulfatase [Streptosporangium sp. NBC_01756]WSC88121.1 sulfatase [Streptosporangium sp. NBC_01756]